MWVLASAGQDVNLTFDMLRMLHMGEKAQKSVGQDFDRVFLADLATVPAENASYLVQRFLGRGGNGTAFLVTCKDKKNVGLQMVLKAFHKISSDQRRRAFLQEIVHLKEFDHPAIVRIYDEGVIRLENPAREYPFFVAEYMPTTARELLKAGDVSRIKAIRIAMNCLSALNLLHRATPPIIHRDLKPENIMIGESGAKLADFGLAKQLLSDQVSESEGGEGEHLQTQRPGMSRGYRTPEQVARLAGEEIRLTTAHDIYVFGTVLYELLTGTNPQLRYTLITDQIGLDLKRLKGYAGESLGALIRSMLNTDPEQRPTALQCLEDLMLVHEKTCGRYIDLQGKGI